MTFIIVRLFLLQLLFYLLDVYKRQEYARENFPGHQALVCTHTDGHNGSGNIHVHIVINSVRKYNTEPQPYMEFDRDSKAGYKHHLSDRYRIYLKQKVMDMCRSNGLNQVDLLNPAEKKISEKEYWAKRRGQKNLDEHNAELKKKGLTPRPVSYTHLHCGHIFRYCSFSILV